MIASAKRNALPQYPICHPEQAKRVEGSSHLRDICSQFGAKILRLPPKIFDFLQSLRMTDFWSVLLLLPGQCSSLVGGVMTPPYRSTTRHRSPTTRVLLVLRLATFQTACQRRLAAKSPRFRRNGGFAHCQTDALPQPDHTCSARVTISKICDSLELGTAEPHVFCSSYDSQNLRQFTRAGSALSAGRGRSRRRRPASRPRPR